MRPASFTARVTATIRLNNSVNGNPRFDVVFDNGAVHRTSSDAGFCYAINNREMRDTPVDVWLTRAGRIEHMEPSTDASDTDSRPEQTTYLIVNVNEDGFVYESRTATAGAAGAEMEEAFLTLAQYPNDSIRVTYSR